MIVQVKSYTAYLLAFVVFVASASAGVDGMVLCLRGDGGFGIETSCGDAQTCCDESHSEAGDAAHPAKHQCTDCTDLPLNGLDTLAANNARAVAKFTPGVLVVSLPRLVTPTDSDANSARLLLTSVSALQHGPDALSTVFRI